MAGSFVNHRVRPVASGCVSDLPHDLRKQESYQENCSNEFVESGSVVKIYSLFLGFYRVTKQVTYICGYKLSTDQRMADLSFECVAFQNMFGHGAVMCNKDDRMSLRSPYYYF